MMLIYQRNFLFSDLSVPDVFMHCETCCVVRGAEKETDSLIMKVLQCAVNVIPVIVCTNAM